MQRAFSQIDIPARPAKPRETGLTMMIDWGIPPHIQRDITGFASEFIDLAKVAVGISGLIPEEALINKIKGYQAADIEPFPGGMYLEMAYKQEKVEDYFAECSRVGYKLIEVSDNVVHFDTSLRQRLIRIATNDYGLKVLGEVGSKHDKTDVKTLISDIQASLQAGAWKVFVEAAEFVTPEGIDRDLIDRLLQEVKADDVIFELPGKWIPDVYTHRVYRMMVWLVEQVGTEVNIANVAADDVIPMETLRTGLGVNMKL